MSKFIYSILFFQIILCSELSSQDSNCLQFDGINDYVSIGDVNDLGASDFTIEAWIYLEGAAANKIINKGLTVSGIPQNAGYSLRAGFVGDNIIDFSIGHEDGTTANLLYEDVQFNKWYHVAGVRMGQEIQLFINGQLIESKILDFTFNTDTNIPLAIGALDRGVGNPIGEFMEGKIDEVRIWTIGRTQEEIDLNKDCAITSAEPNLLAVYNLDSTNGNIANDNSGNNNNGTLVENPIWNNSDVAPICITSLEHPSTNTAIQVYPNPFNEYLTLSGLNDVHYLKLLSITGAEIFKSKINNETEILELKNLADGIYFLQFFTQDEVFSKKIIKH